MIGPKDLASHFERSSIAPLIIKSKGPSIIDVHSEKEGRGNQKRQSELISST